MLGHIGLAALLRMDLCTLTMKRSVWHAEMEAPSAGGCMLALLALSHRLNEVFMNGRGPEEP